jgi:adenosine deaminase
VSPQARGNAAMEQRVDYRDIPKIELHCHLEACFRPATVMEIAGALGVQAPRDPAAFRREWLLTSPLENLEVALARFVDIQRIWCFFTREDLDRCNEIAAAHSFLASCDIARAWPRPA